MIVHPATRSVPIAIPERARDEILDWARDRRILPTAIWLRWLDVHGFESGVTALRAMALRHGLDADALADEWNLRLRALVELARVERGGAAGGPPAGDLINRLVVREGSRIALLLLPDEEFLAALAHTEAYVARDACGPAEPLLDYAGDVLRRHRAPWQVSSARGVRWIGERDVRSTTLDRAMASLADGRLATAADHFHAALELRAPGSLEACDAAIESASRAVEATLVALLDAFRHPRPARRGLLSLFEAVAWYGILPAYLEPLVTAAGAPRCQLMAPQQAQARTVAPELAEASIAAAATAITLLARYLP